MQSEIKQNVQGTNSNRKETRTQINNFDEKEEIQPEFLLVDISSDKFLLAEENFFYQMVEDIQPFLLVEFLLVNIQPEQNEETRIQKNEEWLRNLWDNFKLSNIQIIGVPGGEEEEQEMENLLEQIMKENVPSLAKEIDFQEVQEAQRVPKKPDPRKHTPRHIIITLAKIKDKERILKAAREKEAVTCK